MKRVVRIALTKPSAPGPRVPVGPTRQDNSSITKLGLFAAFLLILILTLVALLSSLAEAQSSSSTEGQDSAATTAEPAPTSDPATDKVRVSTYPDRGRDVSLESKEVVSGTIFGFTKAERSIGKVRYFVDAPKAALEHPKVAGTPLITEGAAPYDLAGTAADGTAKPFDTTKLANGKHMLTTAVDNADGTTDVVNTPFIVYNGPPKLLFGTDPLKFDLPEGGRASKTIDILTSDNKIASYQLSESAPWLRIEKPVLDSGKYSAPAVRTLAVDTTGLDPGTYTTQITTSADGYTSDSQTVTMQVEAASTCSPVPCEEILVDLPYRLDFNQDHGKILDKNNVGTGFTYLDQPTNGTGYMPQNLTMNTAAPGTLDVTTTNGIMFGASNAQDNALAVGIDAPNQITSIDTTLLNPPAGSGKFEQAGLWFGNDEDNYVKLEVISTPSGTMIEYLKEVNGSTVASKYVRGAQPEQLQGPSEVEGRPD